MSEIGLEEELTRQEQDLSALSEALAARQALIEKIEEAYEETQERLSTLQQQLNDDKALSDLTGKVSRSTQVLSGLLDKVRGIGAAIPTLPKFRTSKRRTIKVSEGDPQM